MVHSLSKVDTFKIKNSGTIISGKEILYFTISFSKHCRLNHTHTKLFCSGEYSLNICVIITLIVSLKLTLTLTLSLSFFLNLEEESLLNVLDVQQMKS